MVKVFAQRPPALPELPCEPKPEPEVRIIERHIVEQTPGDPGKDGKDGKDGVSGLPVAIHRYAVVYRKVGSTSSFERGSLLAVTEDSASFVSGVHDAQPSLIVPCTVRATLGPDVQDPAVVGCRTGLVNKNEDVLSSFMPATIKPNLPLSSGPVIRLTLTLEVYGD